MSLLQDMLAALDRWNEWKRMREAPARIDELERRLDALETKAPGQAGKTCPACGQPAMRRTSVKPDRIFGPLGGKRETWTCGACGEVDEVLIDT